VNRFGADTNRVTIADVATRARVSKTTVSHVLSGKRPVAPATRLRVNAAIAELGYRPDGLARSLRTRRSHMVALVIPDITNPFYPVLARGLEDGMQGGGYRSFICNTDGRLELEEEFLHEAMDRGVDGLVMDSFSMRSDRLSARVRNGVSVVRVGTTAIDDPGFDAVHANDRRGAFDAVRHLVGRGCRRVAMIQGPAGAGQKRNEGYLQALDEAGLPHDPELVVSGEWTREGGEMAALRLLDLEEPPTGIFCANDLMALGVLDAARELGVRIPGQVALVGFDDIEAAELVTPALTTVSNPAYETGLMAGILLLERMMGAYTGAPRTATLPCRLVTRATA
jgi:LacI family transcriptional regulator